MVTVLLEYLNHAFSICGCLLLYIITNFNRILLSFGKSFLLLLVHLLRNLLICGLSDIGGNARYF